MTRSQCAACSQLFASETAFIKHRVGSYGDAIYNDKSVIGYTKGSRGCLSEFEMLAKGMVKNERGVWTTGDFDASVFNKKDDMHE